MSESTPFDLGPDSPLLAERVARAGVTNEVENLKILVEEVEDLAERLSAKVSALSRFAGAMNWADVAKPLTESDGVSEPLEAMAARCEAEAGDLRGWIFYALALDLRSPEEAERDRVVTERVGREVRLANPLLQQLARELGSG